MKRIAIKRKPAYNDTYCDDYNPYVSELSNGRITRNLRIGFMSYWFNLIPRLDEFISKNNLEAIYLKHFLKIGYVYWLGLSPKPYSNLSNRSVNVALEIQKLPDWDKDKFGTTPNYMKYCIEHYDKEIGIKLPKLDFVFANLMPTFVRRTSRNYIILHEYAIKQRVPVIGYDLGLEVVGQGLKHLNDGGIRENFDEGKLFNLSGYDYRDKAAHLLFKDKLVHIVQTGKWGLKLLKQGNPLLRFCTWWLPYDEEQLIELPIRTKNLKYNMAYVGNDNRRRGSMNKWYKDLPKDFMHIFGGNYRKDLGTSWPKEVVDRYPNLVFNNPVAIKEVSSIYNQAVATLNLAVPPFEKVGVQVWRHFEAPIGGCVLLLPNTTYKAHKLCFDKSLVMHDTQQIVETVNVLKATPKLRRDIIEMQREEVKRRYTMEINLRNLFNEITEEIEP